MSSRGGMLGNHHYLHHQQQHNPPNPSNNNSSNKPDWLHKYDLIGKIGEGTYGLVFLARIKPPSPNRGKSIAIKKFKQSKDGDGISTTAIREIMLLREISHENVVKLVNVHINPADMLLYLAFDYAEHDLYLDQLDKIFKVLGHPTLEKWPALVNLPHWQQDVQHIQGHKYDNPGLYSIVNLSPKTPAYDLLSNMFEYDPHKRRTAAQALEHEQLLQLGSMVYRKQPHYDPITGVLTLANAYGWFAKNAAPMG